MKEEETLMQLRALGIGLVVGLALAVQTAAIAQQRPSMVILPTQYFSADAASAENVTRGLVTTFEGQGYRITAAEQTQAALQAGGYDPQRHYPDEKAVALGQRLGADLVAYPRLLGVGYPATDSGAPGTGSTSAIVHLRVLNTRTGKLIYFRQISYEFQAQRPESGVAFTLPQTVATAAAGEVSQFYFQRVAGSREELGQAR
jgi:hypothetical protein